MALEALVAASELDSAPRLDSIKLLDASRFRQPGSYEAAGRIQHIVEGSAPRVCCSNRANTSQSHQPGLTGENKPHGLTPSNPIHRPRAREPAPKLRATKLKASETQ